LEPMLFYERMFLHHLANCFRCLRVCVCVSFSLSLALSLTVVFPLKSIPCLNLLDNVGFDVCWLLWFFMPYKLDEDLQISAWISGWRRPMASCHWKMWRFDYVCMFIMPLEWLLTSWLHFLVVERNVIDICDVDFL
jgi:hypothetical protein